MYNVICVLRYKKIIIFLFFLNRIQQLSDKRVWRYSYYEIICGPFSLYTLIYLQTNENVFFLIINVPCVR